MRKKASITVFAALSLMLVAQLLFTLLEAARHYELQKVNYVLITGKHSYVALHRIILEAKSRKLCFPG